MDLSVRSVLRYLGIAVLAILGLAVLAAGTVAWVGGSKLAEPHDVPEHAVEVPTDSTAIAEGARLARFWGCTGCHGRDAGGQVFFETPVGDRIVAPNLTQLVHEYTVSELERAIRHGTRDDGSSVVIMPSAMFAHISDADLGKVIGYLRSLRVVPDTLSETRFGLMARTMVLLMDQPMEAPKIDHDAPHGTSPDSLGPGSTREDTMALGRYLAHTGCPECHQQDLRGTDDGSMPDLRIAAAYSPEQFMRLAREGIALDGTERGLMTEIARGRIARLTDDEIRALHTYLSTLAD